MTIYPIKVGSCQTCVIWLCCFSICQSSRKFNTLISSQAYINRIASHHAKHTIINGTCHGSFSSNSTTHGLQVSVRTRKSYFCGNISSSSGIIGQRKFDIFHLSFCLGNVHCVPYRTCRLNMTTSPIKSLAIFTSITFVHVFESSVYRQRLIGSHLNVYIIKTSINTFDHVFLNCLYNLSTCA